MKPSTETCTGCGRILPAGSAECPNCSKTTALESEEPPRSSSTDLSRLFPLESPLFECAPCERFIEAQNYHGRVIVPRFCPWCGGEVLSLIGKELDGYRIDRLLAEGGFGVLYLASNLAEAKMKMVVKFLRPQMAYLRPELIRVFVEEARLTEEIGRTCWNVVRVHNVRDKPWPYFLEEYIRGTTLQQAIDSQDDGAMDLEECKGYLRGMAKALASTHEHGRVHRDLKPQNVMVIEGKDLPENRVKLLDFGLSLKIAGANNSLALQRLSASSSGEPSRSPLEVAGTPEYMPPEAFDGMNDFTGDIYSFGVTAYEVLTGQAPWDEPPPGVDRFFYWRDCHKSKPPKPLRELRPDAPSWLAKVIARCLEKDKAQRIGTAHELLSELREPIPRWVKPLSAAAIICVAVLAYFAFFATKPAEHVLEGWQQAGIGELDGSTLWISRVDDLASRKILVDLPGKKVSACKPSDPRVLVDLSTPERIGIGFAGDMHLQSLIGKKVALTGAAEMNGEPLLLKGDLEIRIDGTPPQIASPVMFHPDASSKGMALQPGLRLRSSVGLSVEVEEDHPREARLEADGRTLSTQRVVSSRDANRVRYDFTLPRESGTYRMSIVAVDHAGNEARSEAFELAVDNEVDLAIRQMDRQSYLAMGMAFYEIEPGEVLSRLEARSSKEGSPLDMALYVRPTGELSSLRVARLIAAKEMQCVEATDLLAGTRYLLAVRLAPGDDRLELQVADHALPPNRLPAGSRSLLLGYSPPEPPRPEDVQEVSVEFEGADHVKLERMRDAFRLPSPRQAVRVNRILVKVAAHIFQSASCSAFTRESAAQPDEKGSDRKMLWQGECREIESTSIVFAPPDLTLAANNDTICILALRDGCGVEERATVVLSSDTRRPELQVEVLEVREPRKKAGRKYFNVGSWEELELRVRSNEDLHGVTAFLENKSLPEATTSGKDGYREFTLRHHLACSDGRYDVRVEGIDWAGNKSTIERDFHIDIGGPRVWIVGDESAPAEPIELKSDQIVLGIHDANDIDYREARLYIEHWPEEDPSARKKTKQLRIQKSADGSTNHRLSLRDMELPAKCSGEITVRVADALGVSTLWKKSFEMRKSRDLLPDRVPDILGIEWVKIQVGKREIYITKHEISMGSYNARGFIEDGRYVDGELVKRIGRDKPLFWVQGKNPLPYCEADGKRVKADGYPMVGITPMEAKAFANRLGARLPTWEEWQTAACPSNRLRVHPWKNITEGKLCARLWLPSASKESPFARMQAAKWYTGDGSPLRGFHPVEVAFDVSRFLSPEVWQKLDFKNELFHMIGNVGEFVLYDEGASGDSAYRVAGGDFETKYDMVSIQENDVNPKTYSGPNASTGFRMAADADEAFVSKLRGMSR